MYDEVQKARRMVTRFREIEDLERRGETIPQTYTPPPSLRPGQQIFVLPSSQPTVAATNNTSTSQPTVAPNDDTITSTTSALNAFSLATPTMAPPTTTKKKNRLASIRVHTTLNRLRDDLTRRPQAHTPPSLSRLAFSLDLPLECLDDTAEDIARQATCETEETLAAFEAWCKAHEARVVKRLGARRVAAELAGLVSEWLDGILELEGRGVEVLGETFLQAVQRRFEGME